MASSIASGGKLAELEEELKGFKKQKAAELKREQGTRDLELLGELNKDLDRIQTAITALYCGRGQFIQQVHDKGVAPIAQSIGSGTGNDANVAWIRKHLQETAFLNQCHEQPKAGASSVVTLVRRWLEGLVHGHERVHDD